MAQPTNSYDSYDVAGIREDLSDTIYDISPDETPFSTTCAKVSASNTNHEWQTDALRSSAANAHIEGDETTAEARTATTRLGNYTQIFKNAVTIPDTDGGLDYAGRTSEMALQVAKMAREQKLDIEKALFDNNAKVAGDSSTPRELAGVPAWINTNVNFVTGGAPSGANPTGDGTDARTDDGTPTAFSQTKMDDVLQKVWDSGGKPDTVYLSSFQMNVALGFTGMNNQRSTVAATRTGKNAVINVVDVYATPYGIVDFVMSRECRSSDVFVMQSDMWKIATLRGTKNTPLAKTGDASKRQIVTELTLCAANEAASGGIFDNTTS